MKLDRFDPATDAAAVRACHEIYLAGAPIDDPAGPAMSLRSFAGWLTLGWTESPQENWLAHDDGDEPCGWYMLSLPERENTHVAGISPVVHPSRRRAGLGTALVRHAAGRAARAGRSVLAGDSMLDTPGSAFARALGAQPGITEERRVLERKAVPAARLATLRAEAESAASGYSLLSWEGPTPEEDLPGVALINQACADIPREAGREPQHWDTERVRLDERRMAAQGLRHYTVAARSRSTGELAGLTQLGVDPADPAWGFQELTAVARPHRGHRIGLLVKIAMLDLLAVREPQITTIITGNADGNEHMIAINAAIGFRVLDQQLSWELTVANALSRPGPSAHG